MLQENYGNKHYARSVNTIRLLRAAYDKALQTYDVLIMPTIKFKAPKLPTSEPSASGWFTLQHTSISKLTG